MAIAPWNKKKDKSESEIVDPGATAAAQMKAAEKQTGAVIAPVTAKQIAEYNAAKELELQFWPKTVFHYDTLKSDDMVAKQNPVFYDKETIASLSAQESDPLPAPLPQWISYKWNFEVSKPEYKYVKYKPGQIIPVDGDPSEYLLTKTSIATPYDAAIAHSETLASDFISEGKYELAEKLQQYIHNMKFMQSAYLQSIGVYPPSPLDPAGLEKSVASWKAYQDEFIAGGIKKIGERAEVDRQKEREAIKFLQDLIDGEERET